MSKLKLNQKDVQHLQGEIQELTRHVDLGDMMLNASIDLMLAFDTNRAIIAWNDQCSVIFGYSKEEVLGKSLIAVFPQIKDFPTLVAGIDSALKGKEVFIPVDEGSFQKGYYENHLIPLKDKKGNTIGVLNLAHDVSYRVKAEQQLLRLNKALSQKNKELQQRNEELSSFLSVASNDLKDPIRKVRIFSDRLRRTALEIFSEREKELFIRICTNVEKIDVLTDDILSFSRLDYLDDHPGPVNLNHALKIALGDLSDVVSATHADINSSMLPSIVGYRNMLTLLFRNLIANALKFQPVGGKPQVRVTWSRVQGEVIAALGSIGEEEYVMVEFVDNGIGFDNSESENIFLMFFRVDCDAPYPGNGIGLAVCRKIMELHRGFIDADGRPGEGATFRCFLPLDQRD